VQENTGCLVGTADIPALRRE